MDNFTQQEKFVTEFLSAYCPYPLVLLEGAVKGKPVSVLCWLDGDNLRPLAIPLKDIDIQGLTVKLGGKDVGFTSGPVVEEDSD